jgi:hypothetical protein
MVYGLGGRDWGSSRSADECVGTCTRECGASSSSSSSSLAPNTNATPPALSGPRRPVVSSPSTLSPPCPKSGLVLLADKRLTASCAACDALKTSAPASCCGATANTCPRSSQAAASVGKVLAPCNTSPGARGWIRNRAPHVSAQL